MADRSLTVADLRRLLARAQAHNKQNGMLFSRADSLLGALLDELEHLDDRHPNEHSEASSSAD